LSMGERVVLPTPIDPKRTILRIDLRDYKWEPHHWNEVVARDPYGLAYRGEGAAAAEPLPVRADWFVYAASRPPLYHRLLALPGSVQDLEKRLKVDAAKDLAGGKALRAGFNGSGVSRNNRVIERHEGAWGYYWRSYDFGNNTGQQNVFAFP